MIKRPWIILAVSAVLGVGAIQAAGRAGDQRSGLAGVEAVQGGRVYCWPVATATAAQTAGLGGRSTVAYPLVFLFSTPRIGAVTLASTRVPLRGVWLGLSGRVVGSWSGAAGAARTFSSHGVVSAAVEYPAGWPVPAVGQRVELLGRGCGAPAL